MKLTHLLVAALAASSLAVAQGGDGSTAGGGSKPIQVHPDGTTGFSSVVQDGPRPGPSVRRTVSPRVRCSDRRSWRRFRSTRTAAPSTAARGRAGTGSCTRLSRRGACRLVSFDFFCKMNSSNTTVSTGLFLDQGGKPRSAATRSSSMLVRTSAGFRRSTLSSAVTVSRGQVFYIGYRVPSASFRVSLTGGSNGTYFWDRSAPAWTGPFSTRKFAWRINSFKEGQTYTFGTACNTPSTKGPGHGRIRWRPQRRRSSQRQPQLCDERQVRAPHRRGARHVRGRRFVPLEARLGRRQHQRLPLPEQRHVQPSGHAATNGHDEPVDELAVEPRLVVADLHEARHGLLRRLPGSLGAARVRR